MAENRADEAIDWRLTTWEGARRESMRRWADLPLRRIVAALEEMESVSRALAPAEVRTKHARTAEPGSGPAR